MPYLLIFILVDWCCSSQCIDTHLSKHLACSGRSLSTDTITCSMDLKTIQIPVSAGSQLNRDELQTLLALLILSSQAKVHFKCQRMCRRISLCIIRIQEEHTGGGAEDHGILHVTMQYSINQVKAKFESENISRNYLSYYLLIDQPVFLCSFPLDFSVQHICVCTLLCQVLAI